MTYSIHIINLFINNVINNKKIVKISEYLNVSIPTLRKWMIQYEYNIKNKVYISEKDVIKTKRSTNKKDKYVTPIVTYINNNEGCSLQDISNNLNHEISKSLICNILKENNISRKRCNKRTICTDFNKILEKRKDYIQTINEKDFLNSEFIDECSFCINDYSNYGYSEKGKEIVKVTKHKKSQQRITLLASMSNEGIQYEIYEDSINSDRYLDFIEKNTKIWKDKNIIQDNARPHHSKIVKDYCNKNELKMVFNPPYTPEFNPIELLFNKLKTEYRKMEHSDDMINDIEECLFKITPGDLENFIKHSLNIIKSA
jgi:hypothetical protein